jgi:hypothetical protein
MTDADNHESRTAFVHSLEMLGATNDEIDELVQTTDFDGVIDEDALAHERLKFMRREP